jgi:NTE family protein
MDMIQKGRKARRKIGLVLGSGAARGLSHIGVIKALAERDISIDIIAGTSIGAIVGACYAKMVHFEEFRKVLSKDWRQLFQLSELKMDSMLKGIIIREKRAIEWLKSVIGDIKFSDLKIPLAIVATDANTGEEIVMKEGSVLKAIRASISIPAIFKPVKIGNRFLVDGAFANPVPVDVAKDMGANFLIACDTTGSRSPHEEHKSFIKNAVNVRRSGLRQSASVNMPNMFRVMKQALHSMESEVVKSQLHKADIVITPDVGHIDMLAFSRGREAIMKGYKATKNILSNVVI